jgi:hypothetical protein
MIFIFLLNKNNEIDEPVQAKIINTTKETVQPKSEEIINKIEKTIKPTHEEIINTIEEIINKTVQNESINLNKITRSSTYEEKIEINNLREKFEKNFPNKTDNRTDKELLILIRQEKINSEILYKQSINSFLYYSIIFISFGALGVITMEILEKILDYQKNELNFFPSIFAAAACGLIYFNPYK